jgi:hypothetical protein
MVCNPEHIFSSLRRRAGRPVSLKYGRPALALSYEWWFYILVFLTARLSNGINWRTVVPLMLVIVMLVYGRNWLFFRFLAIWLSGFALGYLYATGRLFTAKARHLPIYAIAALLVAAAIAGGADIGDRLLNPFDSAPGKTLW